VLDPRARTDEDRSRVSHPDPNGPPDLRPVRFGEVWENPVTGERATILELPYTNSERRAAAELTAPFGTRLPAEHHDTRVRIEITPGDRFAHMIETLFGLARLGHSDAKGMPHPLQLALTAREFSDVVVFRKPSPAIQRVLFGALAPIARRRGYRATYPQLSRTVVAPQP
jgi:hypothetical protein